MTVREAAIPDHEDVMAAVADDPEVAAWAADPDGYVLVPVSLPNAEHDFFALTPVAASHPIGVLLAREPDGGALTLTSGRPDAVWRLLRNDPALVDPDTIVAVLAPSWDVLEYVGPGSPTPVVPEAGGWRCDLLVRDATGGQVERWRVLLSETPAWQVERP
jgi:hypothetical protein